MAAPTVSMPLPTVRKESSATITTGYSAVSFVPTEHVQTAVSEMDDHIVIDIIVPPTRYLPPTLTVAQIMKQIQEDLIRELENLGQGQARALPLSRTLGACTPKLSSSCVTQPVA